MKTESPHLVGLATPVLSLSKRPDAAGKARPTVNHLTVMNYVKLNKDGRGSGVQSVIRYKKPVRAFRVLSWTMCNIRYNYSRNIASGGSTVSLRVPSHPASATVAMPPSTPIGQITALD